MPPPVRGQVLDPSMLEDDSPRAASSTRPLDPSMLEPNVVDASEPDTYWGGFMKSAADTAKGYGRGLLKSVPAVAHAIANVGHWTPEEWAAQQQARGTDDHASHTFPEMGRTIQSGVQNSLTALKGLSDPEKGGEATGQLLAMLLADKMPELATAAKPYVRSGANLTGRALSKIGTAAETVGNAAMKSPATYTTASLMAAIHHPMVAAAEVGLPIAAKYGGALTRRLGTSLAGLTDAAAEIPRYGKGVAENFGQPAATVPGFERFGGPSVEFQQPAFSGESAADIEIPSKPAEIPRFGKGEAENFGQPAADVPGFERFGGPTVEFPQPAFSGESAAGVEVPSKPAEIPRFGKGEAENFGQPAAEIPGFERFGGPTVEIPGEPFRGESASNIEFPSPKIPANTPRHVPAVSGTKVALDSLEALRNAADELPDTITGPPSVQPMTPSSARPSGFETGQPAVRLAETGAEAPTGHTTAAPGMEPLQGRQAPTTYTARDRYQPPVAPERFGSFEGVDWNPQGESWRPPGVEDAHQQSMLDAGTRIQEAQGAAVPEELFTPDPWTRKSPEGYPFSRLNWGDFEPGAAGGFEPPVSVETLKRAASGVPADDPWAALSDWVDKEAPEFLASAEGARQPQGKAEIANINAQAFKDALEASLRARTGR